MEIRELNDKYTTTNVRWGIVRQKNLSTQLDSATAVITNSEALDIETYDIIELTNEQGMPEYWLVAHVNKQYLTTSAPFKFEYILDLMSLTKWLETIPLPSMSITNIGQNRSISYYIQAVINRYVLPKLSEYFTSVEFDYGNKFNEVCPEQTFSQPTAREYLDWLCNIKGCVIKLDCDWTRALIVNVVDLNKKGLSFSTVSASSMINTIIGTQDASDYVTELNHDMSEVVGTPITETVVLKGDSYVFNSDNAVAQLSHKPYDITRVVVKTAYTINRNWEYNGGGVGDDYTYSTMDLDITKFVVVKDIYQSLQIPATNDLNNLKNKRYFEMDYDGGSDVITSNSPCVVQTKAGLGKQWKYNCLYWNRGDRNIYNVNTTTEYKAFFGSNNTMPVICAAMIEAWLEQNWESPIQNWNDWTAVYEKYNVSNYNWSTLVLEVTYIPYISPRFLVEQKDKFRHLITMNDSTSNINTELGNYLANSLEKNSKLGNESKSFTAVQIVDPDEPTLTRYTPLFNVGMYWTDENNDNYVLSTLEYTIKPNSITYKGILTKNYTNQNLFTLLNREKRYYSLPDASSIVERKEVVKEYYKVAKLTSISINNMVDELQQPIDYCLWTSSTGEQGSLVPSIVWGGNLISVNVSFDDNVVAGTYADSLNNGLGGYKMIMKKYVDDNGEFEYCTFRMFKITSTNSSHRIQIGAQIAKGQKPIVYPSEVEAVSNQYALTFIKDAREKISLNVEKIFYSNDADIILGNKFAELFQNTSEYVYVYYRTAGSNVEAYKGGFAKSAILNNSWISNVGTLLDSDVDIIIHKSDSTYSDTLLTLRRFNKNYRLNFLPENR